MPNPVNPELAAVSWEKTWESIRSLLPTATYCTPASLMCAAERAGERICFLDSREFPIEETDGFLLRKLLGDANENEPVIVITDLSFRVGWKPFTFRVAEVDKFVNAYRRATGACVISGLDVVLVCAESRVLVLYDHEGSIAIVSFPGSI